VVKIGELMMILELHRQGLSVAAIARETGRDAKTIRRYISRGLEPPVYGPRPPRACRLDQYKAYLKERVAAYPQLSGRRLVREIRDLGYDGSYTAVTDFLRTVRPAPTSSFEVRFETPPGRQAQIDFAQFQVSFTDEPDVTRIVWLFSLVLGASRWLWARFVPHQDLQTVLRCHIAAFADLGGIPEEILYDRMKTAVIGEATEGGIVYNRTLLDFAGYYRFHPKACRPYRAKTKGKVERPFRYIRQDFFLGRTFRNLDDLNAQLADWLATVANVRVHATTRRVVAEAFAEEKPKLQDLPTLPFGSVLKLERRVSHEGMVSVGGNLYSVPDATRKRVVEVHTLADEIHIFEDGALIAAHPVLDGRGRRRVAPGHRKLRVIAENATTAETPLIAARPGERVGRRSLAVYEAVGRRLAGQGERS
jgi:transposase